MESGRFCGVEEVSVVAGASSDASCRRRFRKPVFCVSESLLFMEINFGVGVAVLIACVAERLGLVESDLWRWVVVRVALGRCGENHVWRKVSRTGC